MAVGVERQLNVRMAQPFLNDLGVCVGGQEVGSVAMSQIVQADPGKAAGTDQRSAATSALRSPQSAKNRMGM